MRTLYKSVIILIQLGNIFEASDGFCTKDYEYACKEQGITKCRNKTDRCEHGNDCDDPLPIEKPPCKVDCARDDEFWCEKRGECIHDKEVCDCGPDKMFCTKGTYSCENRNGIDQSRIFTICRDGSCSGNCTEEGCKPGHFECGKQCKQNNLITEFRTCEGVCIPAHNLCFRARSEESGSSLGLVVGIGTVIVIFILVLSSSLICKRKQLKRIVSLSLLEKKMKTGFKEKQVNVLALDHQELNNAFEERKQITSLDTEYYNSLCKKIEIERNHIINNLFKQRNNLPMRVIVNVEENYSSQNIEVTEADQINPLINPYTKPNDDVRNSLQNNTKDAEMYPLKDSLENKIRKFITDDFVAPASLNPDAVVSTSPLRDESMVNTIQDLPKTYGQTSKNAISSIFKGFQQM